MCCISASAGDMVEDRDQAVVFNFKQIFRNIRESCTFQDFLLLSNMVLNKNTNNEVYAVIIVNNTALNKNTYNKVYAIIIVNLVYIIRALPTFVESGK